MARPLRGVINLDVRARRMEPLLILIVAASLAAACSQGGPQQPAETTQEQGTDVQPTSPPSAAPAPPATPAQTAAPPLPGPAHTAAPPVPAAAPPAPTSAARTPLPPAAPPKPVAPPAPAFRDITIPAGTSLSVTVLSHLASTTSKVEDPVRGALAKPVVVSGTTAMPESAEIRGTITDVNKSGRVKGKASLAFRFDRVVVRGEQHQIQTARVILEAQDKRSDDVKKGGIGAGLGAVVGGIAGGGTGAAIGAVAGGAGTVLATKGREVEVPAGTLVNVLMQESMTVRVPVK